MYQFLIIAYLFTFDTTTTRYKMEIGPDKTKMMTNNPNGFQREIKLKGLEARRSGELQVLWSNHL